MRKEDLHSTRSIDVTNVRAEQKVGLESVTAGIIRGSDSHVGYSNIGYVTEQLLLAVGIFILVQCTRRIIVWKQVRQRKKEGHFVYIVFVLRV